MMKVEYALPQSSSSALDFLISARFVTVPGKASALVRVARAPPEQVGPPLKERIRARQKPSEQDPGVALALWGGGRAPITPYRQQPPTQAPLTPQDHSPPDSLPPWSRPVVDARTIPAPCEQPCPNPVISGQVGECTLRERRLFPPEAQEGSRVRGWRGSSYTSGLPAQCARLANLDAQLQHPHVQSGPGENAAIVSRSIGSPMSACGRYKLVRRYAVSVGGDSREERRIEQRRNARTSKKRNRRERDQREIDENRGTRKLPKDEKSSSIGRSQYQSVTREHSREEMKN
ncbi:unnamed protein product [Gadus morhua 'NCC']